MTMNTAPEPRLEEIAEDVHVYLQPPGSWCLSNSGILVGPNAVTVIDTAATERRARALRSAISSVTPLVPRTLINTHHHGDHTYGNGLFAQDAVIIGHDACPAQMAEQGLLLTQLWTEVEWGHIEIVPPSVTFAERLTVHVGQRRVDLHHFGPGHTSNDIVAHIPDAGVLFAGDLVFNGGTPFVLMGSVAGTLEVLRSVRALNAETIVPGHGHPGGPELIDHTESYLKWIQDLAREGHAAGLSPLEVARETDLGPYQDWLDAERIVGNLHRAYAEERGGPRGEPLNTLGALMEMVDYNDGKIPACLA
jgi:cyclase